MSDDRRQMTAKTEKRLSRKLESTKTRKRSVKTGKDVEIVS
jgi:hypothetical protein